MAWALPLLQAGALEGAPVAALGTASTRSVSLEGEPGGWRAALVCEALRVGAWKEAERSLSFQLGSVKSMSVPGGPALHHPLPPLVSPALLCMASPGRQLGMTKALSHA